MHTSLMVSYGRANVMIMATERGIEVRIAYDGMTMTL
jgi:hypothetical protein